MYSGLYNPAVGERVVHAARCSQAATDFLDAKQGYF